MADNKRFSFKSIKKSTRSQLITYALVILVYIAVEVLMKAGSVSSLIKGLLVPMCTYSLVAIGLNLCVGYLGELSLGHAGFMCVGAFSSAFVSKLLRDSISSDIVLFLIALATGIIVAAVFGFLIAIPVLRLRGDYLAIVTLAFGEIIKNIINVLYVAKDKNGFHFAFSDGKSIELDDATGVWLVNGAKGINRISNLSNFTIGIVLILVALFIVHNLVNSRSGRAIMSIRDNRIAAESVGINITKYKLMAFTISAAIAGAGGVLYAHNLSTVTATPANFGYNMSITILVFVVLGGMGSFRGSIIAAVLLTLLPEVLRGLSDYRMLIYSIVLIAMMLFNWAPKSVEFRKRIVDKLKNGRSSNAAQKGGA
jgi:branched-chain amino acid transport system permease protein